MKKKEVGLITFSRSIRMSAESSCKPRDWYFIAEQPAAAPHLAHPEGWAALRIVLVTVPRISRSCDHFPNGSDLHLLHSQHAIASRFGSGV